MILLEKSAAAAFVHRAEVRPNPLPPAPSFRLKHSANPGADPGISSHQYRPHKTNLTRLGHADPGYYPKLGVVRPIRQARVGKIGGSTQAKSEFQRVNFRRTRGGPRISRPGILTRVESCHADRPHAAISVGQSRYARDPGPRPSPENIRCFTGSGVLELTLLQVQDRP